MKYKTVLWLSGAIFWNLAFGFCMAQEAGFQPVKNPAETMAKIQANHRATETMRCHFTQEKLLSFMQDKVESKGIFTMKKGNKMRIEYTQPFAYLVVINGARLTVKDGKKITRLDTRSDKSFRQLNEILARSLQGDLQNIHGFTSQCFENKEFIQVKLLPSEQAMKEMYSEIKIMVDKKTNRMVEVELIEKTGDNTRMKFEQPEINKPVDDKIFEI